MVDDEELSASAYHVKSMPRSLPSQDRSRAMQRPSVVPFRPRTASNPPTYSRERYSEYEDGEDDWDDYEDELPSRGMPRLSMRQQSPWRSSSRGMSKLQSMRLALGIADNYGDELAQRLGYRQLRRPFVRRLGNEDFRRRSLFTSPFRSKNQATRFPRGSLYSSRPWTSLVSLASDGAGGGRRLPQRRSFGYNPRGRGGRWRSTGFNARGRGGRRGGGRGRQDPAPPSKEELDKQLDDYMAKTRGALDKDLDAYMTVSA